MLTPYSLFYYFMLLLCSLEFLKNDYGWSNKKHEYGKIIITTSQARRGN